MVNNKVRRLPVVDDGKLVGLVTERDVFRWFVQATERAMPESVKGALSGYEFLFI
jgi:CBS domain-containing protein